MDPTPRRRLLAALISRLPSAALLGFLAPAYAAAGGPPAARQLPDTTSGIHVFNDRIHAWSPGLVAFAATHYAGTQKLTRAEADLLRALNPDFVVLHYRLGMGLGYRQTTGNCVPNGTWFQIIDGEWVQEWPGDSNVDPSWFFTYPTEAVFHCGFGWYLMELDDVSWRANWIAAVMSQIEHNDADGLFADSFMVPNYLSTAQWEPDLPGLDPGFEAEWSDKLERFLEFVKTRLGERYLVPNVGTWVTTRDETDYGLADGVHIEGFAREPWELYGFEGWQTQLDRLLGLIGRGRIVMGQSYAVWSAEARLFTLASYLLIKGERSFVDLELGGDDVEWWPEYEIPIGAPLAEPATEVAALRDPVSGLYVRAFTNGLALANPNASPRAIGFDRTWYVAQPSGGGAVPSNGELPSNWRVDYAPVTNLVLAPGEGAVLLADLEPHVLEVSLLHAGAPALCRVSGATPGALELLFATRTGTGSTPFPSLGLTLGLDAPRLFALVDAGPDGTAAAILDVPDGMAGETLWLQAAEFGSATQVVERTVQP